MNCAAAVQPSYREPWRPIFTPTRLRIVVARGVLLLFGLCALCALSAWRLLPWPLSVSRLDRQAVVFVMLGTWSAIYLVFHWSYRPQNLLGPWLYSWVDPGTRLLANYKRHGAKSRDSND